MGAATDRSNGIIVSYIYYYTAADDYNLRSRIKKDHYRGRFQF